MPGRYGSRATKFLYLDGARMTGADGPLTKSESETELLDREVHAGRLEASVWSLTRVSQTRSSRLKATPGETREPQI